VNGVGWLRSSVEEFFKRCPIGWIEQLPYGLYTFELEWERGLAMAFNSCGFFISPCDF